jgi:hypothetical protein
MDSWKSQRGRMRKNRRYVCSSGETRKFFFIKHYMGGQINFFGDWIIASITFMMRGISKKNAHFTAKGKFVRGVGMKKWITHNQNSLNENNQLTAEIIYYKENHCVK